MRYSTTSTRSTRNARTATRRHLITTRSTATLGGAASAVLAMGGGTSYGGHPRART